MKSSWQTSFQRKRVPPAEVAALCARLRAGGKRIATLNGCFDLLHAGHLHMIYEASLQGDALIVALNSDASIRGNKGETRPIIPLEERMQMMAAVGFVDYVTWFDEADPRKLLEQIRPDVHVNGAEYGPDCIEAQTVISHGGRLHVVGKVPGLSTSQIIHKIQATCD